MGKTSAATQDYEALARKLEELWRVSTHPDRQSGSHESMAAHYADQALRELGVYPPGKPLVPYVVASLRFAVLFKEWQVLTDRDVLIRDIVGPAADNALALARSLEEGT